MTLTLTPIRTAEEERQRLERQSQTQTPISEGMTPVSPSKPNLHLIPVNRAMSRTELSNLGVTERTSAQQRKVITDVFRREGLPAASKQVGAEMKAARTIAEDVRTGKLTQLPQIPFGFLRAPLPGGFGGALTRPIQAESSQAAFVRTLRNIRKAPGDEQSKAKASAVVTRQFISQRAETIRKAIQEPHDAAAFEADAQELKGKFLSKTYRRWERGSTMVVGGGLHLAEEMSRLATAGKYGENAGQWAKMYHDVLKRPEMQPVVETALDKYFGGAVETAPFLFSTLGPAALAKGVTLPSGIAGFLSAYGVEGNNAYQAARDRGESERLSRIRGITVGLVNGGIEVSGGSGGKYFKNKQAAAKAIATRLARAKTIGRSALRNAVHEGLKEELPQEAISMVVGGDVPRKPDGSVDFGAISERLVDSAVMGTILGGVVDAPISTIGVYRAKKALAAQPVSAEKPPQVTPIKEVTTEIGPTAIAPGARTGLPSGETVAEGAVQPAAAGVAAAKAGPGAEATGLPNYQDKQAVTSWLSQKPARPEIPSGMGKKKQWNIQMLQHDWDQQFGPIQKLPPKERPTDIRPDYLKRLEEGEGSLDDVQAVAGDVLREKFGWPQRSAKSEAEYYEIDENRRIRLAQHDVAYPESDVDLVISVGPSQDADVIIPENATVDEIRRIIEESTAKFKPAPAAEAPQAEEEETPEEAKVAQAKLAAEAAQEIEPNLYIGNVTAGMKKRMSETGQFKAEDIKGFTEKGWPTKRTKIKLSRGEAEMYLDWLEKDLQDRVDNNKINNDEQIALAHADWGDIAALRRSLGVPVGTEPFRVVYAQKPGMVVRDQGEIAAEENEIKRLQEEFGKATSDIDAEEILTQIEARQMKIDKMQRAMGKAVSVIKDTSSMIYGAVEPSRLQESKMTVQEVLRAVMKRSARYAKMAYAGGRKELRAGLRAKARAKARMKKAVKTIRQNVPMTVDFYYREAIEALRSNFDLKSRSKVNLAKREGTLEFMRRVPESDRNIPVKLMEEVSKKPLNDMTIEEIETVASEVKRLIEQGRLKRRLTEKPKIGQRKEDIAALTESTEKIKPLKVKPGPKLTELDDRGRVRTEINEADLSTLGPARVLDKLDNKQGFKGRWHRIFYDGVKDAKAPIKRIVHATEKALNRVMKSGDISMMDLNRRRTINGKKYSLQQIFGVYAASLNPESKLYLIYGHEISEADMDAVTNSMTPKEKALADWILDDYEKNYPRFRRSVIEQENQDPGKVQGRYSPIRTTGRMSKGVQEEIQAALEQRRQLRKHNVTYGATHRRIENLPDYLHGKMRLDFVSLFLEETQRRERYINLGPQIRRMNKILGNRNLRRVVESRFGTEMLTWLDGYVNTVANPYVYRQYGFFERMSARLRRNVAIAYLWGSVTTISKQPAALLFYLRDAGPIHLMASLVEFSHSPLRMIERVRELDPELREVSLERELEEIKSGTSAKYIRTKVTESGFAGIYFFDMVPRTIGWNAVYQRAIAEGESPAEAVRQARDATLRTQNAAEPEDLPAMYRTNEFLNWFTIFTNQTSKMWSAIRHDIPADFRNREYRKAMLGILALALNSLIMWMITHRRLPKTPKEIAAAFTIGQIETIPLIGKMIIDGAEGWENVVPIVKPFTAIGRVATAIAKWDLTESQAKAIGEGFSIGMGLPYIAGKRAYQAITEKQPSALIGAPKPEAPPKRGTRAARATRTTRK